MARQTTALLAFNRGEVSQIALPRVDIQKLQFAAECQLNWEPKVVGTMGMRAGLGCVGQIRDDQPATLIPFVFSKDDTAVLEITPGVMRVWIDDEQVVRPAVSTTVSDPGFVGGGSWTTTDTTAGASVSIGGGRCSLRCPPIGGRARIKQTLSVALADRGTEHGIRIVVDNGPIVFRAGSADGLTDLIAETGLDTGTHALACTPNSDIYVQIESTDAWAKIVSRVSIDAAGPLEIPVPWQVEDLDLIRHTQSGDVIFTASHGLPQYKIERRALHGWSVVLYRSGNGPFQTSPGIVANFTPSTYYGNGTLTSDRPYFKEGHVGCLFRLFSSGQRYQTELGAANAFSPAVRVSGVGTTARNYSWSASGSWSGTITLQRSFDGPDSGFTDVAAISANGTLASNTGGSSGSPDLDNAIAWERVGFKGGEYGSGTAVVISSYTGGGGFAIVRVTNYVSPTQVAIEILVPFSSLTATTDWLEADWSDVAGYPTAVGFYGGRLVFSGRDLMWFSQSAEYTGFGVYDLQGQAIGDSGAIIQAYGEGPVDSVNWVLPLTRPLFGREMSIASARSSSFDDPLTATNFSVKDAATQGAARLPAFKIDKRGVFVSVSGRVYELSFDSAQLDYSAHDLTRLNTEIYKPGFYPGMAARQPDTAIYLPRLDGQCAVLLYDPDDEVVAWWRIATLGNIEPGCVLPSRTGTEDRVYVVVKRRVDGVDRRFIETFAPRGDCIGGRINRLLDSHVVYDGPPTTTVTVAHLPNSVVQIWADGRSLGPATTDARGVAVLPGSVSARAIVAGLSGAVERYAGDPTAEFAGLDKYEGFSAEVFADQQPSGRMGRVGTFTVQGGKIALPNGRMSTSIVACFGFVAPFQSAKLAYAQTGSPLTQKKRIDHLGLVLYDTHAKGIAFGQRFDQLDDLPAIEEGGEVDPTTIWGEYDEAMTELPGEWTTDARLCLLARAPLPCKVGAVAIALTTHER